MFSKKNKNMKKKVFGGIAILAIAVVAAWNVNLSKHDSGLSGVSLANVEALAQDNGESSPNTSGSCKWKNIQCPFPSQLGYGVCISNGDGVACNCGGTTHDPLPC